MTDEQTEAEKVEETPDRGKFTWKPEDIVIERPNNG